MTVKAAAVASGVKNATEVTEFTWNYTGVTSTTKVYDETKNFDAFGASFEVAYAADAFSGKLAADFGMKKTVGTDEFVPGLDVVANAVISSFTVDAYYQYGKEVQFISAQVKADLNTYEVPVVLTVYGKNVADKDDGQKLGGSAEATLDAYTITVGGSYTLSSKNLGLSGSVAYADEKFAAEAGVGFGKVLVEDGEKQLFANASISSDALVSGATLKLAYGPKYAAAENNKYSYETTNFLDKEADKGAVTASCTIKF